MALFPASFRFLVLCGCLPAMLTGAAVAQAPVRLAPDADRAARVGKLVASMTLEEKVSQLENHAAAIPRLGIPAYDYWSEGLHGIARSGYATLFPQAIGMAATWDTELVHREAETISIEARAKHSEAVRHGNRDIYYGLTIWSPNINIFRDPRWGRGQETYGEDPFLTSRMGVAFVSGLQGDSTQYLRAVATPKHFAVHSGPESERHRFNVEPSPHDLADTYLPAFRATVTEAHAQSVMCAYNSVDGEPACANTHLLGDILRRDWHFDGFVTSDCGAVTDIADGHKYSPDVEHAAVAALRAGTDTSCGSEYEALTKAVHDGLIQERELDVAVERLFLARYGLGLFDPATDVAYEHIPFSEVDSLEHAQLALRAARESMVLLKNNGVLPLHPKGKTIGVIGANAASLAALEGNYNAIPSHPVTPLDGLRAVIGRDARVLYAQGSSYVEPLPVPVPETVFRTGTDAGLKAEYFDNTGLSGKPVLVRTDKQVEFDWNGASPAAGIPATAFGVRWTGTIAVPTPGDYRFTLTLNSCYPCRDTETDALYLDDQRVGGEKTELKESRGNEGPVYTLHFADTKPHPFRVEYTHASPLFGAGITLNWFPPAAPLVAEAVHVAEQSDVVIAFVGLSPNLEGEEMPVKVQGFAGGDRTDLELPATQQQMLEAVAQTLNKTGKPLVVVLMNGSALAVNWAQQHASAILEAWYPGEAGGAAIAETLVGANNPAGRLPVTFYKSVDQLPVFDNYAMQGRTYRYFTGEPLYKFGDGLSYTHFTYSGALLSSAKIHAGDELAVQVQVTNAGDVDGEEVVEVYLTPPAGDLAPARALVGFLRLYLPAKRSQLVSIGINPRQLGQVDAAGHRAILPGSYVLRVGGAQPAAGEAGLPLEVTGKQSLPD